MARMPASGVSLGTTFEAVRAALLASARPVTLINPSDSEEFMGANSEAELNRKFIELVKLVNIYLNHFPKFEAYNSYVEECRVWGVAEKAKLE